MGERYWRQKIRISQVETKRLLDRWVYNSPYRGLVRKVDNGLDDLSNSPCRFLAVDTLLVRTVQGHDMYRQQEYTTAGAEDICW